MRLKQKTLLASSAIALALAGCAGNSGSNLVTSSTAKPAPHVAANPTCVALAAQISAARREGTPSRVHAVAKGTTKSVRIKRASIAKVADLDRLNAEFQAKCSKYPGLQTASTQPSIAKPASIASIAAPVSRAPNAAPPRQTTRTSNAPIVAVPKQ